MRRTALVFVGLGLAALVLSACNVGKTGSASDISDLGDVARYGPQHEARSH